MADWLEKAFMAAATTSSTQKQEEISENNIEVQPTSGASSSQKEQKSIIDEKSPISKSLEAVGLEPVLASPVRETIRRPYSPVAAGGPKSIENPSLLWFEKNVKHQKSTQYDQNDVAEKSPLKSWYSKIRFKPAEKHDIVNNVDTTSKSTAFSLMKPDLKTACIFCGQKIPNSDLNDHEYACALNLDLQNSTQTKSKKCLGCDKIFQNWTNMPSRTFCADCDFKMKNETGCSSSGKNEPINIDKINDKSVGKVHERKLSTGKNIVATPVETDFDDMGIKVMCPHCNTYQDAAYINKHKGSCGKKSESDIETIEHELNEMDFVMVNAPDPKKTMTPPDVIKKTETKSELDLPLEENAPDYLSFMDDDSEFQAKCLNCGILQPLKKLDEHEHECRTRNIAAPMINLNDKEANHAKFEIGVWKTEPAAVGSTSAKINSQSDNAENQAQRCPYCQTKLSDDFRMDHIRVCIKNPDVAVEKEWPRLEEMARVAAEFRSAPNPPAAEWNPLPEQPPYLRRGVAGTPSGPTVSQSSSWPNTEPNIASSLASLEVPCEFCMIHFAAGVLYEHERQCSHNPNVFARN